MSDINKDDVRARIQTMLRKAPNYLSSASVQTVREFKKWHAKAVKDAASGKEKVLQELLITTIQKYSA